MPSEIHQWLVVWLCRRMERDGYAIVGADAYNSASLLPRLVSHSLVLGHFRPDAIALHRDSSRMAIGEAKTAHDILNTHTWKQLGAMSCLNDQRGRRATVYFAFPRSCLEAAAKMVLRLGIRPALRIKLISIPDTLLTG